MKEIEEPLKKQKRVRKKKIEKMSDEEFYEYEKKAQRAIWIGIFKIIATFAAIIATFPIWFYFLKSLFYNGIELIVTSWQLFLL